MTLYFVETEMGEESFFREALPEDDLRFVASLAEVEADAEVVSCFIYSRITADFLAAHPRLRLVCTRSGTLENIDLAACRAAKVAVGYVPSYGETTVVEHAFALMLAVSRRLREVMTASDERRFTYEGTRGFDLEGKTLGLLGLGRVGQRMVPLARAFGMRVLGYDPHEEFRPLSATLGFEWLPLEELLAQSQVLSLHLRLTAATHHLLNRESLARCRRGVLIVNTARGGLIDTHALREALESGQVGGAGLDVLEDERALRHQATHIIGEEIVRHLQSGVSAAEGERARNRVHDLEDLMKNEKLLGRANVIFTPHVAFNSVEAVRRLNEVTVENIRAFQAGRLVNSP